MITDKRERLIAVIVGLVSLIVFGGLAIWFIPKTDVLEPTPEIEEPEIITETATSSQQIIGSSVLGRDITAYRFGTGPTNLFFVGGIHGGYEWNSILLAYEMIDSITAGEISIPKELTVHIIPNLNPDGTFLVTNSTGRFDATKVKEDTSVGLGRFNANDVDLNRNFDCKWQPESTWRGKKVSAGKTAFSEPEASALRDYVTVNQPQAVVFWHSQANAVYASECKNGILSETLSLMNTYAKAANYQAVDTFDAYPVTGDAEGWLASINIPAITVEFSNHTSLDWTKNLAGFKAVLDYYQAK